MRSSKFALPVCLGLALMLLPSAVRAQYKLTNLVSNQFGAANHTDPLLVNAWGLAYGPGGPIWIADNKSGWSTIYNRFGVASTLQVFVPQRFGRRAGLANGDRGERICRLQNPGSIYVFPF